MAGWNQIKQIRTLEDRAHKLGMRFAPYRHDDHREEVVSLVPEDQDSLPIYTRDALLFAGSLEDADHFMQGIMWAREYDRMVVDKNIDQKREKKESLLRQQGLLQMIKNSDKKNDTTR
jgi:hypothetical protein